MKNQTIRFVMQVDYTEANAKRSSRFMNVLQSHANEFEGSKLIKCESINCCSFRISPSNEAGDYEI